MPFKPGRRNVSDKFEVKVASTVISKVHSMTFLGVVWIQTYLGMGKSILLGKKIAKGIGIINKAKHSLNQDYLLTLCYSLSYIYIIYAIEVWGSPSKSQLLGISVRN